jgi:hypothetical protein
MSSWNPTTHTLLILIMTCPALQTHCIYVVSQSSPPAISACDRRKDRAMAEPVSASCIQYTPNLLCSFLKHACKSPDRRAKAATEPASLVCVIMFSTWVPVCTSSCELSTHRMVHTLSQERPHGILLAGKLCIHHHTTDPFMTVTRNNHSHEWVCCMMVYAQFSRK